MTRLAQAPRLLLAAALIASGCANDAADSEIDPAQMEDLPVGGIDLEKADAGWGQATTCKPIPTLEPLVDPAITISLDGLSLHLYDRAGSYDRVFPIGPGALEHGESLTPTSTYKSDGLFWLRADLAGVKDGPTPSQAAWGWNHECRMWWTSETGKKIPVFAGLPFLRLQGHWSAAYGIHGPVDNYYQDNGGTLRRQFVSHGCVRMESADLLELYARIRGHKVPVRLQQGIERYDDGRIVDVAERWIGRECQTADDCGYEGATCRLNPYSGRSSCSMACDLYCPDKHGYPSTFCIDDPDGGGMCVSKYSAAHDGCFGEQVLPRAGVSRHGQSWKKATVCLPDTHGWIGDRCLGDHECTGGICRDLDPSAGPAGMCTEPCNKYCPDLDGHAPTFCVGADEASGLSNGMCVAACETNVDCPLGTTCELEERNNMSWVAKKVCLPY